MLIDWFTVIAQVFNFLILVWLLKRFLYKPILNAIDAREKRIAAELADAEAKKAEAGQERDEFIRRNEEFDRQRAAKLDEALDEAKAERLRLLDEARKESDILRARWQEALQTEHLNLSEALTRRTREEVFAIARKTLADLATENLEAHMADRFIRQLRELDAAQAGRLKSAFAAASAPAIVRSTFALPDSRRRAIEGVMRELLAVETEIRFETAPDAVSGIEMTANGYKIAWSIGNYLASLDRSVDELLKVHPQPEGKTGIEPQQGTDEHGT
ncbi:MAG: F0F1 ATP synthase subunit B [Thermodesulfobacteriota bacterium]